MDAKQRWAVDVPLVAVVHETQWQDDDTVLAPVVHTFYPRRQWEVVAVPLKLQLLLVDDEGCGSR